MHIEKVPTVRVARVWSYSPLPIILSNCLTILLASSINYFRGVIAMRRGAFLLAAFIAVYLAVFWIFADKFTPRFLIIATVIWTVIATLSLVAIYFPRRHNGHNGNGNGNNNHNQ